MIKKDNVVAIIVARGGSKSIPRKNVLPLKGKPLIAWPIELACSVPRIDRVVVSTDDEEIAAVAKKYGAEVPFLRPAELAQDQIPTLPVLQHCVRFLKDKENYQTDIILLLYPTSPFLKKSRVEEALDIFEKTGCNSVLGVVKDWGRFWNRKTDNDKPQMFYPRNRVNRQYYEPLYRESGAVYFSRSEVLIKTDKLVDEDSAQFLIMDENENIDIDNPEDWERAENFKK